MPKKLIILIGLALFLGSLNADTASAQDPINFQDYALDLIDYTLPNGLRVILAEDHSAPVVAVDIWYHVGGANDPMDRSGFAHLFEHMMFEGSENVGNGEYFGLLDAIGARSNAYTASDQTAYWQVAPSNELPRVLWLESDRMAALDVNQDAFDTQRQVVIEEFNQRVANQPFGPSNQRLFTQPFLGYVPYERPVIGNIEDLEAATLPEVQAFFDTYYKPNNATLVIAGDINIEQTQALVQAYFSDIPAGDPVVPITNQYPLTSPFPASRTDANGCQVGLEETYIDGKVEIPRMMMTAVGPPRGNPDFYALSLLSDILGSGDSARLEQNVVRAGLATTTFLGLRDYLGASILFSGGIPNAGDSVETVQDLLRVEFDSIIADGVTEEELTRVKQQVKIATINAYRSSVLDTAEMLQDAVLNFGDPNAIADELAMYEAVTTDDIQRVAQAYLCETPLNSLITLPEGDEILADYPGLLIDPIEGEVGKDAPPVLVLDSPETILADLPENIISRSDVPASLPVNESSLPAFEIWTMDNGLDVIFVEQHEVPKVRLNLFVGGSETGAPAEKQGVANLMASLLTKGTRIRTAAQIAESIESIGGSVNARAGLESVSLSVDVPTPDSKLAFHMLAHLARFANFPQEEFDVAKAQSLTLLQQSEVNPSTLANRQFGRIAFGDHPYGYYTSSASVEGLTRADVVDFHKTYFKPNNALLVIVGDLTSEKAHLLAEDAFKAWKSGDVPDYMAYPTAVTGDTSVIYLVDRPGSQQATIHIGNLAIDARSPDRYALTVTNAVLGSGASSRLFSNLREDKGYTYGVYSRFARPNDTGSFRVVTDVNQDNTADAIREILKELDRIRTEPISDQEMADAKGRLIGNFALAIEEPSDFARQLASRHMADIPLDELGTYLQSLEQVTIEDTLNAAATYINADQPIIVIVGDASVVEPQLVDLGDVVVVE